MLNALSDHSRAARRGGPFRRIARRAADALAVAGPGAFAGRVAESSSGQPSCVQVLSRKFSVFASLSAAEMQMLEDLVETARYHPPHRDLCAAEANPPPPRMIVAGWACRYRQLPDERRQILSLRLPGDFIEPLLQLRLPSPYAVAALTELETVSGDTLAEAACAVEPAYPGLARAVRMIASLDDRLLCDQIVRLGRQNACERFAHLMLSLRERLARVGLAEPDRFAMPLTQEVLADVLGLSVVHVNRTVQQLRREELLELKGGTVILLQPEQLRHLASSVPLPPPPFEDLS